MKAARLLPPLFQNNPSNTRHPGSPTSCKTLQRSRAPLNCDVMSFWVIQTSLILLLLQLPSTDAFFTKWFSSAPRKLIRRDIPSLQDVMDDAVLKRSELEERQRREALDTSGASGEGGGGAGESHLTREELEESKRKSKLMTQLLDSIFNNYDMYIRPGFQQSEPLLVESNMVLTSMGPFSDFEAGDIWVRISSQFGHSCRITRGAQITRLLHLQFRSFLFFFWF
ncbi:uncharacterized protein LOC142354996 isoform X2 [Convolutriloba macropyga]|uniref:uncharacterized protein LOC142354996 isoform X2 n=1 Tax=Convolutriloba macropyga TaxID=536237 RepID=UPI003F520E5E